MKNIIKTGLLAVLMLAFSCDTFDLDLQNDPNQPTVDQAETDFVYNSIQLSFATFHANIWFPTAWPARMMQGTVGSNYQNAFGPAAYNFIWRLAYSQMFPDMDLLTETTDSNPAQHIYSGSARVMKAYVMVTLVDLFNNVPYSEAGLGVENFSPNVDDGAAVYAEALTILNEGISILEDTPETTIAPAFNPMYNSAAGWIAAGNSLRIKILNARRLVDDGAAAAIEAIRAEGNYITDNSANWEFPYGTNQLNPTTRHPFYQNAYNAVGGAYMSNYFMWQMVGEKIDPATDLVVRDPRVNFYFYRPVTSVPLNNPNVFSCLGINAPSNQTPSPAHYQAVDPNLPYCVASIDEGYYGRDFGNASGVPPDGPIRTVYGLYPGGGAFDDGTADIGQTNNNGVDGALGQGIEPILQSSFMNFIFAENDLDLGNVARARVRLEQGMRDSFDRVFAFSSLIGDVGKVVAEDLDGNTITLEERFLDTYDDDVDTYVDYVLARFDEATNDTDRLNVIIKEYHIAAWGNGIEPYNNIRRTGMPLNAAPLEDPLLFQTAVFAWSAIYPQEHVNLNRNAVQKAVTDKVFWDNTPADAVR